uniref:Uncharacterized protein n=1 Tax=Panagrellus redivivus TaxID=6233 RepID=A0A7E4W4W8_PANRE
MEPSTSTISPVNPSSLVETTTVMILNITATISNTKNTTDDNEGVFIPHIVNIFERHPWLFWAFLASLVLVVVSVVVLTVYCIVHNKKKVIRRGSSQAIFNYDDAGYGCLPCFRRYRGTEKAKCDLQRQNSASNMSPYGRSGPLPPPRTHLPPLNLSESIHPATTGINITSMKGIPEIDLAYDQHRPLPPIRPKS